MKANVVLWIVALSVAGCGKNAETTPAKTSNSTATGNPLTAPADYLGAVGKAKRSAERTVDLASLNRAIQLFHAQEDRFPATLNELVAEHYLPSLPSAPAGMRIIYDASKGEVRIVKQQ
ncbi:MAG: hypothetical protein FJ403_19285 [Verrucomicrobia bacterium]|nr:hypothetical protein [Verrucomicrobiota bacterium]